MGRYRHIWVRVYLFCNTDRRASKQTDRRYTDERLTDVFTDRRETDGRKDTNGNLQKQADRHMHRQTCVTNEGANWNK